MERDPDLFLCEWLLRVVSLTRRIAEHPRLPRHLASTARQLAADAHQLASCAKAAERLAGSPHPTILIVDDNQQVVHSASRTLAAAGFTVVTASSAASAARAATHSLPRGVLVDLHMTPLSGLEFVRWIRTQPRMLQTRIAVMTGDYLVADSVAAELRGFGATLHLKPLLSEDLISLARDLIRA